MNAREKCLANRNITKIDTQIQSQNTNKFYVSHFLFCFVIDILKKEQIISKKFLLTTLKLVSHFNKQKKENRLTNKREIVIVFSLSKYVNINKMEIDCPTINI